MVNIAGKIGFEEYVNLLNGLDKRELRSGSYILGDNMYIDINATTENIRNGLIRTRKFELRNWPSDSGKYQLEHLATGAHVLARDEVKLKETQVIDPKKSFVTIHPGDSGINGCYQLREVLPDILEFAKAERVNLRTLWRKADDSLVEVTYEPK